MPNFAINSTPSQISQTGTKAALIRNTGSSPVFLDAISAVSPDAYGVELQPLDSVTWEQGQTLWAVCAPGDASSLSVLYDASGVSLGAVSAVVTGDVTATIDGPVTASISGTVPVDIQNASIDANVTGNIIVDSGEVNVGGILTPVEIQGGAIVLFGEEVVVPANSFTEVVIPGPPNGNTMYGVDVSWELLLSGSGFTASTVTVLTSTGTVGVQATAVRDTGANEIGVMGYPDLVSFTAPMKKNYPLTVRVGNTHASSQLTGYLEIRATSYSSPYPVDTMETYTGVGALTVQVTDPAVGNYITLPASMSTLKYRIQANAAGLDNVALSQWNSGSSFASANFRTSRSPYYQQTGAGAAWDIQEFATGPFGRPHRLTFFQAFTGIVRIQLFELVR